MISAGVPRNADNIKIPLTTDEALRLELKVKPTKDMSKPGASGGAKKRAEIKLNLPKIISGNFALKLHGFSPMAVGLCPTPPGQGFLFGSCSLDFLNKSLIFFVG